MFQHDAIARLLRDNDPATVQLVKSQLLQNPGDNAAHIRDLLGRTDDAVVSAHARDILATIEAAQAGEEFDLLCRFFPEDGDIESACWLLARCLTPGVDPAPAVRQLDQWGRDLASRLARLKSDEERVAELGGFLGGHVGLRGNTENYYHPDNSMLPRVIESKLGIPISLTLLYIIVGRRAGLRVEGINLPGHFIARVGEILFDPFHRGRVLSAADCEGILRKQNLRPHASYLTVASSRLILIRTLANLLYIFQETNRDSDRDRVAEWLKALDRE
jgi:regulator of sirC expression with transglutaminase-like and TPR domain